MNYCHALATGNWGEKLTALREAAVGYSVARTLPSNLDRPARYERLLDIIDPLEQTQFQNDPPGEIRRIERKISRNYGGRNVLSATTKFLWIKIKRPILIFDSQARNALGIRNNNGLEDFYVKWRAGFEDNKTAIVNACLKLPDMNKYALQQMTKASIREISNQPWFHERVFDTYLWHKGTNA